MLGVDHLDLVVTDIEHSLEFYTELLGPLGFTRTSEIEGERAERVAEIETDPREYDYTPGYYAVFFYDPDGIKLEIVHRPRASG